MSKAYFNRPALDQIMKSCLDLGERKSADYGAVRDVIADNGLIGIVVRLDDKQARLLSLVQPGHKQQVKDESIRDTLMDVINYATYAISILDGTWGVYGPEVTT